jgi:hypothetical protein
MNPCMVCSESGTEYRKLAGDERYICHECLRECTWECFVCGAVLSRIDHEHFPPPTAPFYKVVGQAELATLCAGCTFRAAAAQLPASFHFSPSVFSTQPVQESLRLEFPELWDWESDFEDVAFQVGN